MSFVSPEFSLLIVVVLALLALTTQPGIRKLIVLAASCGFYAWWDWRFLGLLATVTLIDYYVTRLLVATDSVKKRRLLLWFSVLANLGFLGFFKYFNFFIDTLNAATELWGWRTDRLNIVLPIGISFYTFETLSYVIDVYRGVARPARSLLDYAVFITFFPRLVAGPIMRASQFLPQLEAGLKLDVGRLFEGGQYFLRGMLKKMVIADNVAGLVDQIYAAPAVFSPSAVWLGVAGYSIQILCDFSGYTDMAIGIGKMLGIDLPKNFNLPYTAQSISEFWNRWHLSLSTWLRDYLYVSLGGNRKGELRTYVNLMITMLLGGLWHGASWNFVLWGGLHGVYLAIERKVFGAKPAQHPWNSPIAWLRSLAVFVLVSVTWVPFRSPNPQTTILVFQKLLFIRSGYDIEWYQIWGLAAVACTVVGGWLARRWDWRWPVFSIHARFAPAAMLFELLIVAFFAPMNASPFIYFQF